MKWDISQKLIVGKGRFFFFNFQLCRGVQNTPDWKFLADFRLWLVGSAMLNWG